MKKGKYKSVLLAVIITVTTYSRCTPLKNSIRWQQKKINKMKNEFIWLFVFIRDKRINNRMTLSAFVEFSFQKSDIHC